MPTRHGGSALKNAITWPRRSCFLTTTFSAASIPWTVSTNVRFFSNRPFEVKRF
jgi:hypothetical protein